MVADSGERGKSQKGVVGADGSERRYEVKSLDRSSEEAGKPHSRWACAGYIQLHDFKGKIGLTAIFRPDPYPSISP